ncbi:hypothetical protein SAMN05216252_12611 [Actinacidiphila glaucinigra]|uniref:Uncharacterized protein n=1 Tax=Actinacidiphila glaucinigra TaxID=235986 RepID=A0A239MQH7_9ACTN|nr:hypothetical protein SAMN05216252_12611 [Actinacidiphila glaucinigra]
MGGRRVADESFEMAPYHQSLTAAKPLHLGTAVQWRSRLYG